MMIVFLGTILIASVFEQQLKRFILFCRQRSSLALIRKISQDDKGIWQIDLGEIGGKVYNKQYHPVLICNKALELDLEISDQKDQFLNIADWLTEQIKPENNNFLLYNFPFLPYAMKPPWISALAQGKALQVLTRAHIISGRELYLEKAEDIVFSLSLSHKVGGTTYKTDKNGWWFEEYPAIQGRNPGILNGIMYTLIGLIESFNHTGSTETKKLIDLGILALESKLPDYDRKGDSFYDSSRKKTNDEYHSIHIEQLEFLTKFSDSKILKLYRNKWKKFQDSPFIFRLFRKANKMNLAVLLISMILSAIIVWLVKLFLNMNR